MKDIRERLLATFQIEHRDHVEQIRAILSTIGTADGQLAGGELDEVFRRAHSLKGAARAVDLRPIEELSHRLETLFARVRQGGCALNKEVIGVIQRVLDSSEDCMAALAQNKPAPPVSAALQAIERVLGIEPAAPAEPGTPALADPPETPAAVPAFQAIDTVRITAENFDGLFRSAGSLATEIQHQEKIADNLNGLVHEIALIAKEGERARQSATVAAARGEARSIERLTKLLDTMERRVHLVSRRASAVRRLHQRSSWNMQQLGKQLQRDVWQARVVPAESLLEGCRKMLRDLARDEGKEIDFRTSSGGAHADRRVLDALKDPIMHILRNAVSHGIEPPAERTAKGKTYGGRIELRIDTNGQRLTLTIQDDGRGVDFSRVAEVAVREGIISESVAAHSSAQDLTRILLRPGFTTSRTVTSLSGRGMGLSVVYEAVRRLQGDLEIQPAPGGGTTMVVSVPVSISTHRLVLVKCGDQLFAIPTLGIDRLERIKLSSVEMVEGKPVTLLNDQPTPLTSIHALLGLEHTSTRADANTLHIVVMQTGGQRVAVVVDAILRETEAVIQDLGPASGCNGKISSGVVLEEGEIAFVINPMELMQVFAQPGALAHTFSVDETPAPPAAPVASLILVVDDSMTTRTLEKSILEAHGYRVSVAVDGLAALEKLRQEKADLVIADVEMPRLNGFGLVEAMKKDRELARIPVIIVTSLEQREHRERGLAVGADAYIVKRKFDQEELLAAIRQLL